MHPASTAAGTPRFRSGTRTAAHQRTKPGTTWSNVTRSAASLASANACSTARVEARAEIDRDSHMAERRGPGRVPAPRDQESGYGCLGSDALGDRPGAESVNAAALVRSHNDHVRTERTRVQQDDLRGITLLNPVRNSTFASSALRRSFAVNVRRSRSVPAKRLIGGHRLHHDEFRAMTLTERERVLEGTTRGLREVDRCENARELLHDAASKLGNACRPHYLPS